MLAVLLSNLPAIPDRPSGTGRGPSGGRYRRLPQWGLSAARDERKRDEIANEIRELYAEVYEQRDKLPNEVAERAAEAVSLGQPQLPKSQPAKVITPVMPPPERIDWRPIAGDRPTFLYTLEAVQAALVFIDNMAIEAMYEDEALVLLLSEG